MAAIVVTVEFYSRRQNTNVDDDQYRIWLARVDAEKLALHLPALDFCIKANKTWTQPVHVAWTNGQAPHALAFGAYANQSGEMSFTASRKTKLFDFAETRHANQQEGVPINGSCRIENGTVESVSLALTL